ncbi:MAG TPA: hypothetical protein VIB48_20850 [Acidimicrobiia bacterium]|jgi:hypothetical protein
MSSPKLCLLPAPPVTLTVPDIPPITDGALGRSVDALPRTARLLEYGELGPGALRGLIAGVATEERALAAAAACHNDFLDEELWCALYRSAESLQARFTLLHALALPSDAQRRLIVDTEAAELPLRRCVHTFGAADLRALLERKLRPDARNVVLEALARAEPGRLRRVDGRGVVVIRDYSREEFELPLPRESGGELPVEYLGSAAAMPPPVREAGAYLTEQLDDDAKRFAALAADLETATGTIADLAARYR